MRTALLALTLSLALPSFARAADGLSPETFAGNYRLVEARYGLLCDENMQGLLSHSVNPHEGSFVQIDLGAFPFIAVNGGPQHYEDSLAVSDTSSYTTADSIVMESKEVSKVDGEVSTSKTVATLHGKRLHLVSRSRFAHPGGTHGSSLFECVYDRIDDGK